MRTRIKSHLRKQGRHKVRVKSHLRNYSSTHTPEGMKKVIWPFEFRDDDEFTRKKISPSAGKRIQVVVDDFDNKGIYSQEKVISELRDFTDYLERKNAQKKVSSGLKKTFGSIPGKTPEDHARWIIERYAEEGAPLNKKEQKEIFRKITGKNYGSHPSFGEYTPKNTKAKTFEFVKKETMKKQGRGYPTKYLLKEHGIDTI